MRDNSRPEDTATQPNPAESSIGLATFDQYRGLLFSIAYRMLGSVADAEDMLQETYLRWQVSYGDEILSPRSYLVTILSRLCMNHLQSARVQREEYVGVWLPEPIVTDSSSPFNLVKIDESLSMAFLIILERLTPIERAVFLLKEVFEYEYREIANILGHSEANCRQTLKRAKEHVAGMQPRFRGAQPDRDELLESFLKATGTGDMKDLVNLLTEDVVLHADGGAKGIAVPKEVYGADKVARGVLGGLRRLVPGGLVRKLVHINGHPGLINYLNGEPHSVLTIEVREGRISSIYVITNPEKLRNLPSLTSRL